MKTKNSINNKIIRRMLIIVIVICAAILGCYSFIVINDICTRANESITEYFKDMDFYLSDKSNTLFFVYECYAGDDPEKYIIDDPDIGRYNYELDYFEADMADHYLRNRQNLKYGEPYTFFNTECFLIVCPMDTPVWQSEYDYRIFDYETQDSLVYCNATYLMDSLIKNLALAAGISAAIILLLFFVSRYTVKMLDEKDTGMKNFFANASHELKTPLMAIRGNVDGIKNGYVDTGEGCDIIGKQVDRMSHLIGDILDISRLDSKAVKPEMLDCDVREIIYDAASAIMPEAKIKGITLQMDIPYPIFRKCDEAMLFSAFSNILTNDVRYADSLIIIKAVNEGKAKTNIIFENDGIPISDEDRIHIFDRFYKGEKGQSGIGMALAQEYVKLHGSEICAGVLNGHTVFEILL